tara:strand:+ start:2628 stop:3734 length:1107 start_codon:yes stop_codon:yes gene_type:complete
MNVLSLFDGMSCMRIVLDKMGITPANYYAAEIDKFAIAESKANWPDIQHMGDVTNWKEWPIDWASIDLLVGGSPCQGFSFAGKQLAFDDPRSKLFFVYVDILNHIKSVNPNVKFMLENVKMKKEYLAVITDQLGVEPVFINSALVSAQNRQRYYWANWHIEQPQDRGILLADILEKEPTNPTFMSDKFVNRQKGGKCLVDDFNRKASSLSAMEYVKNGRQGDYIKDETFEQWYEKTKDYGGSREEYEALANPAAIVGRKINPETGKREDYNKDLKTEQYLEVHDHGKARCLSTVAKDCLVSSKEAGRHLESENKQAYRKLTVIECCRLQGVPDNYFKVSSNTQAYKMLGNGWQCDTIEHIFNCLKKEG